jgi:hypothetical protein
LRLLQAIEQPRIANLWTTVPSPNIGFSFVAKVLIGSCKPFIVCHHKLTILVLPNIVVSGKETNEAFVPIAA